MKYLKNGKYSFYQNDALGSGTFGKVFKGYNHPQAHYVALKQIALKKLETYGDQMKETICSEITVMRKFSRKIIQVPCSYLVRNEDCFRTEKYIYIVMELCEGGSLLDYAYGKKIPERQSISILYQIVQGIKYLNDLGIVHRDLKPENIFVKKEIINGSERRTYKIGDFGFAAQKKVLSTTMGTYPYMAPQVYKHQPYGIQADIFSLGVIAHQILFAEIYFMGKDKWEIAKNIKQKPYVLSQAQKQLITKETEDFLERCLTKNQNQRITPNEILEHPIFDKVKKRLKVEKGSNVLADIYNLVEKCRALIKSAQLFATFSEQSKRPTQFIQIYLLKESYINLNRLSYSLIYKQNHLSLPEDQFQYLIGKIPAKEYERLSKTTQQECLLATALFNTKFKQIMGYIGKFGKGDQQLIKLVVNQQPYDPINPQIFREEVLKWIEVLRKEKNYEKLYDNCLNLVS